MNLKRRLLDQIRADGPITIAHYMTIALHDPQHGYYATRRAIGEDFITAPGLTQMFGELIGLWCLHEWRALGAPAPFHLIELGPGTGALMSDALRATKRDPAFIAAANVALVELSPGLRATQIESLNDADARHYDRLEDIAAGPSLIVANEFLDCFPIRQFVRDEGQWRERLVGAHPEIEDQLIVALARDPLPDPARLPPELADAADGAIAEFAPALPAFVETLAARLNARPPGRALFIDYADAPGGDTLQAVRAHQKIDPLAAPGECDLTAHVDFAALGRAAHACGLAVHGPVEQGAWLRALGLDQRAEALIRANPTQRDRILAAHARLTAQDQMGSLFKVICLSHRDSPTPAGF